MGMLIIRCAACKRKLFRYRKLGRGALLRCHKSRIEREWEGWSVIDGRLACDCGSVVGHDKGRHFRMVAKAFTASGTKEHKLPARPL
jgi:hypothetical protein